MTSLKAIMREPIKPKRNFVQENKGRVRKLEEQNREKKSSLPDIPYRNKKYDNVKPKVVTTNLREDNKNLKLLNKFEQPTLYSAWGAPSSKSSKSLSTCDEAVQCNEISLLEACSHQHRSTQTIDNISEAGYGEGKIIIPSDRVWTSKSLDSLHLTIPCREGSGLDDVQLKSQYTQRTHASAEERVRGDQETVSDQLMWPSRTNERVTSKSSNDPLRAPSSYQKGVVPRYLRERQEDQVREAERVIRCAPDPDCPPGHRKLTEEERLDSLSKLKATQDDLIVQLNKLPVHLVTLRAQNHRHQLDTELDKVEKLIIAFSKSKVFVDMSK